MFPLELFFPSGLGFIRFLSVALRLGISEREVKLRLITTGVIPAGC